MTTAYSVRWSKTIALRRLMLLLSILLITTVIWFISAELFNQDAVGSRVFDS